MASLPMWTQAQILDQLDYNYGSFEYEWTGATVTYAFPTGSGGIYGSEELTGFQPLDATQQSFATLALELWDDLVLPDLQLTGGSANIEFGMTNTGIGYAHAYFPTTGSVWFSKSHADLVSPQVGAHSFLTYVHEIGHAFGLDHMGDYNGSGDWTPSCYQDSGVYSLMSYFGPNWGPGAANGEGLVAWADWVGANGRLYSPQTPMLNDIMAIQSMYGAETTTRTSDTTYGFHSSVSGSLASIYDFSVNPNPIVTLYDAGGNDTLDLSGWSTSSLIDLNPGAFSSCNSMTCNIAIAYSCNIENAIGGSGSDTLVGNALDNRLAGGAGNDSIDGGAGNDSVVFAGAFSDYSYTFSVDTGFTFISPSTGTDIVRNVEYFVFDDVTRQAGDLTTVPPVGAVIVGTSRADVLNGSAGNDEIYGLKSNDRLDGGSGDDSLYGGLGNDLLTGGEGADRFVFDTAPNTSRNRDTLTDFQSGTDLIQLRLSVFKALGTTVGDLSEAQFWAAAGAVRGHDADDRLLYNTTTGALYYDADGSGRGSAVQIALLGVNTHPGLSAADFELIA